MSHLFALACLLSPLLLLTLRATYCSFLFLLLHFFCFEAPQRAQSTQPVFHATKLSSELESVREKTPAPSPLPLFRSGRRHYCQLYCCEHLTAFRLLSFVFCVSFLCIACCIFHTLQTAERERPNDTTRPGASATAPAPHAPPHATASNHLICPALLACLHAYPLLLLSAPLPQSIWRAGRLRCAESRRKCHLDAEAELEEEEAAETNLPQAGEICNVNVIIIDFVANLPTQAHPCTCLLRPSFCPFYSVFGVLLSLSENVTTLAKRFAINESTLELQLNLVYRSL